ncbi:MAG TPA: hypothetical protein VMX55_07920 [candidate division Zixibacteria bacterium]|nr:hypothetical protein [candidate division Zixibacteria bacterium]
MSLWRNKTNRTILISSIFLVLILALIIFLAIYDIEVNPAPSLEWLFKEWVIIPVTGVLFWGIYFTLLLLIGSIREKMNALPGWTEVVICMILTLLPAIFLGNLDNYATNWVVFGIASFGVVLITLWFLMSSTPKEEAEVKA